MTNTRSRDPLCRKRRSRNEQTSAKTCACGGNCGTHCACRTDGTSLTLTPNPLGQTELAYRIGTHADFFAAMKARLSDPKLSGLKELAARTTDDPVVALLDAWAGVADTLTFYQERIAGEAFLGTASERQSVADIAALVGYQMESAAASEVFLAYELDPPNALATPVIPGAPRVTAAAIAAPPLVDTRIEQGSAAQSIPGPGQLPQTFETDSLLLARAEWNVLIPRQTHPQRLADIIYRTTKEGNGHPVERAIWQETWLYLKGIQIFIKPNDPLLLVLDTKIEIDGTEGADAEENFHLYRTLSIEEDAAADRTRVEVRRWRDPEPDGDGGAAIPIIKEARPKENESEEQESEDQEDAPEGGVFVLRTRAAVFGHNAPLRPQPDNQGRVFSSEEWELIRPQRVSPEKTPRGTYTIKLVLTQTFSVIIDDNDDNSPRSFDWKIKAELSLTDIDPQGNTTTITGLLDEQPLTLDNQTLSVSIATSDEEIAELQFSNVNTGTPEGGQPLPTFNLGVSFTKRKFSTDFTVDGNKGVINTQTARKEGNISRVGIESAALRPEIVVIEGNPNDRGIQREHTLFVEGKYVVREFSEARTKVSLDIPQSQIVPDRPEQRSFAVIDRKVTGEYPEPGLLFVAVNEVKEITRADYGITGKVTELAFDRLSPPDAVEAEGKTGWINPATELLDVVRSATVLAQSERLELAEQPETQCVGGLDPVIPLNGKYPPFVGRRQVILAGKIQQGKRPAENKTPYTVTGTPADGSSFAVLTEAIFVAEKPGINSALQLTQAVEYCFERGTAKIYANVVGASHGESRTEILGSGEAAKANQSFVLRQKPIAFVRNKKGLQTTLQVRVGSIEWMQIESLRDAAANDSVFTAALNDDGTTTITFGDGIHGARLPSGVNNVRATFRIGGGEVGNVRAGQISTLLTRPLGVKGVINPLEASGGSDGETPNSARRSAPRQAAAFGRSVSVLDYEIAALGQTEIARAHAVMLSSGKRQTLYIAVLGPDCTLLEEGNRTEIAAALQSQGDPRLSLEIVDGIAREMQITARIALLPGYLYSEVEANVQRELTAQFGFAAREFGQGISPSAISAVIQDVPGVAFVDIEEPANEIAAVSGAGKAGGGFEPPELIFLPDNAASLTQITDFNEQEVAV